MKDLYFTKELIKTKNTFARVVYSCTNLLTEHKEVCLSINGAQSVRFEKGTIEFKNYFKQKPISFHADFECNLDSVKSYEGFYSKIYQDHIHCSFAYKPVCVDDKFSKPIVVYIGKNAA